MTPEEKQKSKAEKQLDISIQIRSLEIELFWKRSIFFWGFISVAFTGYAALRSFKSDLSAIVACFGMVCAFAWTLLNRGSKYWQESWESKVERYEGVVVGKLFAKEERVQTEKGFWLQARKYSVSKLSIALSDYIFLAWLTILITELLRRYAPTDFASCLIESSAILFVFFSFGYLILLFYFGRSTPRAASARKADKGAQRRG